jgi:peptide/nickel transport system permease protein
MWFYIVRRVLYSIPILIGVNILTFALFFYVNSPDDIARIHLGGKYISQEAKDQWKEVHRYHLPLFYNAKERGLQKFTQTIFFEKSVKLFVFDFGLSDTGRDISQAISDRYLPSLLIAVPSLLLGLLVYISVALCLAFCRGTWLDTLGIFICVVLLSISALFYIVLGQFVFAKILRWFPISGYTDGLLGIKFLLLPIIISIIAGLGASSRWYRSIFIEELHKDYVRTAGAKGLSDGMILFKHVLKNALIPILTGVVAVLPLLFMGSLLLESFFAIPGLGSYTIDAIRDQDFAIVRVMVFLGTVLYIFGLLLTDISYSWVDPRVRFA